VSSSGVDVARRRPAARYMIASFRAVRTAWARMSSAATHALLIERASVRLSPSCAKIARTAEIIWVGTRRMEAGSADAGRRGMGDDRCSLCSCSDARAQH